MEFRERHQRNPEVNTKHLPDMFRANEIAKEIRYIQTQLDLQREENKNSLILGRKINGILSRVAYRDLSSIYPEIFDTIARMPVNNLDTYADEVGKELEELLRKSIPIEELVMIAQTREHKDRQRVLRDEARESLSDKHVFQMEWNEGEPEVVRIHIASAKTLNLGEQRKELRTGMRNLAQAVQNKPELSGVSTILAPSWIVAAHPKFVESLGFVIDPKGLDQTERERLFPDETRPIGLARMSRETLIERYGS